MRFQLPWMALVVALAVSSVGSALAAKEKPLVAQMRRQSVAVVPPKTVYVTGDGVAATHHSPLQGYDVFAYPQVFAEVAVSALHRGPTRWSAVPAIPEDAFYEQVESSDPDGEPATSLDAIPPEAAGCDYIAVFRYAEFAYAVEQKPIWSRTGQIYMHNQVILTLDLQMVVYDVATGEPLGTYDAEFGAEVPEIQAKPMQAKAFYRATAGALRRMRVAVAKGNVAGIDD